VEAAGRRIGSLEHGRCKTYRDLFTRHAVAESQYSSASSGTVVRPGTER
jgi:hypothetical protein